MNLFSTLEDTACQWPESIAVSDKQFRMRYRELRGAAESLAADMKNVGLRGGDKVGLLYARSPEYIAACFAVIRAGGIAVTIPRASRPAEIATLAKAMALDGFCYSAPFESQMPAGNDTTSIKKQIFAGQPLSCFRLVGHSDAREGEREQLLKINTANIRFSSGTTSDSKGVIVSHETILNRARIHCEIFSVTHNDRILFLLSMMRALPTPVCAGLVQGATIVGADAMNMHTFKQVVAEFGITLIYAAPLFYRTLVNQGNITKDDLSSVRHFVSWGAALSPVTSEMFRAKFGHEIRQFYGSAEGGDVLANFSEDLTKRGSVGKPVPGIDMKLVSSGSIISGADEIGEIFFRTPGMFEGYYRPWRLKDEALEDGWFRTGDLAKRDKDGFYWIVGRSKEAINVGGLKVFPSEIESVLLSHPAVEEVLVFGVTDPLFGEVPHAQVKLGSGVHCSVGELVDYADQRLSVFKTPRNIEFVTEFPKTATGKLSRKASPSA
jgi:long-chain acyl-CoA synthetase